MTTYRIRKTAWLANCLTAEERLEVAIWLKRQGATEEQLDKLKENVCFTFDLVVQTDGEVSIQAVAG